MPSCSDEAGRRRSRGGRRHKPRLAGSLGRRDLCISKGGDEPLKIFQQLEHEGLLQWIVLARLPLSNVFQFRLVSKQWKALLCSPEFGHFWSRPHKSNRQAGWLLMVSSVYARGEPELIAYDAALGSWISFNSLLEARCSQEEALAFLGGPFCKLVNIPFTPLFDSSMLSEIKVSGSASGLMCFLCNPVHKDLLGPEMEIMFSLDSPFVHTAYYLVVLNPITGWHTLLPPNPKQSPTLQSCFCPNIGVTLQSLPDNNFRVFVWDKDVAVGPSPLGALEFYDSKSKCWRVGRKSSNAREGSHMDLEQADLLVIPDEHYLQMKDMLRVRKVLAYSVERDEWSQVETPGAIGKSKVILRHKGSVFLAANELDTDGFICGFVVWELHPKNSMACASGMSTAAGDRWVQVAKTPREFWKGIDHVDSERFDCLEVKFTSIGSLICMTSVLYGEHRGKEEKTYSPLVYDLDTQTWYNLPSYKGGYKFTVVCGFQPSLTPMASS